MVGLSPWVASLSGVIEEAATFEELAKFTRAPEALAALKTPGLESAEAAVTAAVAGETLLLSVAVVFDGKWHFHQKRILVLTEKALYRVDTPADKEASVVARLPLDTILSVEGAGYGFVIVPTVVDPEGESAFMTFWYDKVWTPRGARNEVVYWLDTDHMDPTAIDLFEWRRKVMPLVCTAIRSATRLAISGTEGSEERISGLRGEKRWAEGGSSTASEMQPVAAVA